MTTGLLATATAAPFDDPHVGGVGFSGPTTGDVAAIYWNPAALALMQGREVTLVSGLRQARTSVQRASIDPATGLPGTGRVFPQVTGEGDTGPFTGPPGRGAFFGAGFNILGRFTLAVAAYTPFSHRIRFDPDAEGALPTRYHALSIDLHHFMVVPAIAFRIGKTLRLGLAPGFVFSGGRMVFDYDTALATGSAGLASTSCNGPCGAENPAAAARYDLAGRPSLFASPPAFTVAGGLYLDLGRWQVGAAYQSRPFGTESGDTEIQLDRSRIVRAASDPAAPLCPPAEAGSNEVPQCADGRLAFALPAILTAGATYHPAPGWAVSAIGRYLVFSGHEQLAIRVTGPAAAGQSSPALPERMLIARRFQDAVDLRLRLSRTTGRFTTGVMGRVASPTVPSRFVNPAAFDGWTLEPALLLAADFGLVRLAVGYAFSYTLKVNVDPGAFDPGAATACADAGFDLSAASCDAHQKGRAFPTAAGRYGQTAHLGTVNLSFRF
jgi:long-subunit fatty acid transport protein